MIAIVHFQGALQVAQNFTGDADRLKTVLEGGAPSVRSLNGSVPSLAATASLGAGSLLLAVRSLARDLGSAPGRKTLVLLSADSQLRAEGHNAEINAALDACNRANVAIYGIDTRGFTVASPAGFPDRAGAFPGLRRTPAAGEPDCNPGLNCQEASANEDSSRNQLAALRMLSAGSGGFFINNTNDLAGGLEKIGKEQNEYYLLGYTPPDSPEGSCHKLRVKVDRGGTAVRARAGYCNARSNNVLAGSSIEKELESLPASPSGGANASMVAPFFYAGDLARVNLAMEIPLKKMKTEKERGKLRADGPRAGRRTPAGWQRGGALQRERRRWNSTTKSGSRHSWPRRFTTRTSSKLSPAPTRLTSPTMQATTAAEKWRRRWWWMPYSPRNSRSAGSVLSRQYGPASDPRLHTDAMWTADRTPLIADGMRIVPSGSNRFKKTDAPAVYAEIYEPLLVAPEPKSDAPDPNSAPSVGIGMRIFDRKTGEQKLDTGPLSVTLPAAASSPAIPTAKRVPIDSLAPGSYRLELEASDSAGKSARRTADFDIE